MCRCQEDNHENRKSVEAPRFSRREVLATALASGAVAALTGCGGGSLLEGGGGGVTQRAQTITLNLDTASVAVDEGTSVNYVVSYTGNGLQSAFWGSQQPDGITKDILEALVWDTNADEGVRVKFDGRGLPSQVINEKNQAFVTCFWEADRSVFKFYQPSGAYIGGCTVTGSGPTFAMQQLADSAVVGLFVGALSGATDGIFSITLGGTETKAADGDDHDRKAAARGRSNAGGGRSARRSADQAKPALTRIAKITSTSDYPPQAKALITAIATEYLATGKSDIFAQITQTALKNTGLSGLYLDNGLSIVRGILGATILQQAATDMLTKLDAGVDLVAQEVIRFEASSPGLTTYLNQSMLPAPSSADTTAVSGVAVSREFGTVSLSGLIDSTGKFTATGAAGANIVTLTGTVNGNTVSGQWTSTASSRGRGSGDFNGNKQPVGQCQTQQLSGGQGTFTNTYDLKTCGKFQFSYQAFSIPDHFQVLNGSKNIFDTGGLVSGGATVDLYVSGAVTLITVVVLASEDGTAWNYTVGCPS